jgi:hypothetical protein
MEILHLNTSPLRKMVNKKEVLSGKNRKNTVYTWAGAVTTS